MSAPELRRDLAELKELAGMVARASVKSLLQKEVTRVEAELAKVEKAAAPAASTPAAPAASAKGTCLPTVKISNYGWDESDKFVKLYITLNGVEKSPKEDVGCEFTRNSFSLWAIVGGVRHEMTMRDLTRDINVEASLVKQKTDMLVLMCRKVEEGTKWSYLTKTEKMAKEKSAPKMDTGADESKDPQESLMGLMKQMYDDGDDEMKRTIRKAWHEGQSKKGMAGMEGLDLGM